MSSCGLQIGDLRFFGETGCLYLVVSLDDQYIIDHSLGMAVHPTSKTKTKLVKIKMMTHFDKLVSRAES